MQIPNILIAGKTNLESVLPKPHVELAIQIARGSADFLRKDMVAAVDAVKDQEVRGNFLDANRKAAHALSEFATWLERERLPKATLTFSLGAARYQRWLTETELVDLPPEKILEIGLAKLKEEQKVFADAAKVIDPDKSPAEVFKQIQKEHPTAEKLIPDIAKNLDANPCLCDRAQDCRDSAEREGTGEGNAAVRSRDIVRLDGYPRTV